MLRKFSDGRTHGHTDGQADESGFIGRCPTNVERPINFYLGKNQVVFHIHNSFFSKNQKTLELKVA